MNKSNLESLVFYHALLTDAEKELQYILTDKSLPGYDSLVNQFQELIKSHKANILRLESQIADPAAAHDTVKEILETLENLYNTVKGYVPEPIKKWIETLITAAKKVLEIFKNKI